MWQRRLHPFRYRNLYCSIDGIDFQITEPQPFDSKWFRHKFKSAGLRYETVVSTKHGFLVWCCGPYPCGSSPDVKIFNDRLKHKLQENEKLIADDGYKGNYFINKSNLSSDGAVFHKLIRARHETVHKRIRHFGIMKQVYRHQRADHSMYFYAVANVVSLVLENGEPLFNIA